MSKQLYKMVRTYLACIQSTALGSRYIIDVQLQNNNLDATRNFMS